ncbi:serine protease easter-like [Sitodiplosis mosellana]|uniref:serine protease easter-like n=1 Tax=Sitodiplosis mosellana TaxID=263140 RepID=UPI0024445697|nr:serine protease easter-like [Sitodiplosis mosellana]
MFMLKICIVILTYACSSESFFHRRIGHTDGFGECWMPNNRKGLCLPLKDCSALNVLANKKRLRIADRLFLKRSLCGHIGLTPLVCCPKAENITTRFDGSPLKIDDLPTDCGRLHLNHNLRLEYIIGGKEARIYDSPWLTLLRYEKSQGTGFHCGGVLINKDYVLTAAHCVTEDLLKKLKMKLISVRLGEWDVSSENDCQNRICSDAVLDVPVKEVILHEDYRVDAVSHAHDIALILLDHSVMPTIWIRPICLPIKKQMANKNYDNIEMDVAGWGHTSSLPNAKSSNKKMQVTLNGVSKQRCDQMYKRFNVSINEGQMCAGGEEGYDSCRGDSGSPLMWYDDDEETVDPPRWYAVGIVSFGLSQCAQANFAGVYTRVDKYIDWIINHMKYFE